MIVLTDSQATLVMMALRSLQKQKTEWPGDSEIETEFDEQCPSPEELEKFIQSINLGDFDIEKFPVIVGTREDRTIHSTRIFESEEQAEHEFTRFTGIADPDGSSKKVIKGITYTLTSIGVPAVMPQAN